MSRFDAERFRDAVTGALEPFSLREAAERTGISPATLSRVERGEVPSLEIFLKLCEWMGASPADFALSPATPRLSLTHDGVVRRLREAIEKAGDQQTWAKAYDLSPSYVSDVLRGRREAGAGILAALGLERVVRYKEVEEEGGVS